MGGKIKNDKIVDKSGFEPKTSPMLRGRATNYATCPAILLCMGPHENSPAVGIRSAIRTASHYLSPLIDIRSIAQNNDVKPII